jgi:hypothetical protein
MLIMTVRDGVLVALTVSVIGAIVKELRSARDRDAVLLAVDAAEAERTDSDRSAADHHDGDEVAPRR